MDGKTSNNTRILIVEDELAISDLIKTNLTDVGYLCTTANEGIAAAELIANNRFDLIILDMMLPHLDGMELLEVAKEKQTPVIFLTAKDTLDDKVVGLKRGAEDYLTKPFSMIELLARVAVVLRRYHRESDINIDGYLIDREARTITKNKQVINLTKIEFDLLLLLIDNQNIALLKEVIYERVWGDNYLDESRTVDLHIQRLRGKLGWKDKLKTIHGVGYRLEINNEVGR